VVAAQHKQRSRIVEFERKQIQHTLHSKYNTHDYNTELGRPNKMTVIHKFSSKIYHLATINMRHRQTDDTS